MSDIESEADCKPLVSVIVPCYNGADYVCHAVRSALEQTYPHIEVAVVDDGSTDGSADLLRSEFGDRIDVIVTENAGASAARNTGLSATKGEFVQFLDADNVLTRHKIAVSVELMLREPETDLVFTALHEPKNHEFADESAFTEEELAATTARMMWRAYDLVLPGTGIPALETGQPLYRRGALVDRGGWDEELTMLEDTELACRMALTGAVFRHVETVGVIYRDHPGERVTAGYGFDKEAYFRTVLKMIELARRHGRMSGEVERFSLRFLVWIAALECARHGRREHAARYLRVAREISPRLPGPAPFRAAAAVFGPLRVLGAVGALVNLSLRIAPRRTRALFGIPEPD
ncbi:Glycosyl transferase family 2 [Lentzea fradiae]|uniref:Glycosyl transferase family 2 n=1 Tax=Lentzea fradiae TaxID=200378 RepID=A0A1G8BEN7_9PSEU|nr:glycosyltransferase family 2 protein [Lentzea fradiae]SDH31695.1 Glycosyl transferase family 2 [Lentzea fradiae]